MPESVSFPIRIFLSESVCFHSRLKEPRNAPALPPFHASPPIRVRLFTATLSRLPPRLSPRLTAHLTPRLPTSRPASASHSASSPRRRPRPCPPRSLSHVTVSSELSEQQTTQSRDLLLSEQQ